MKDFLPLYALDAPAAPFPIDMMMVVSVVPEIATPSVQKRKYTLPKVFAIVGLLLLIISWGPSLATRVLGEANKYTLNANTIPVSSSSYQPSVDSSLPYENSIKISSIKVEGLIYEAQGENYEEALKKGLWRVSDHGTPYDRELPTIIAAHRYGYVSWSNIFRRKNSFYNLPDLKAGETIEILWRQRKYTYAVYGESEGLEITDYTADLILYTCEDLSSDIKIFKYARLLEI